MTQTQITPADCLAAAEERLARAIRAPFGPYWDIVVNRAGDDVVFWKNEVEKAGADR